MSFQNPNILYALFALLIPIIVHLFQLRKFKKTTFTNVQFLKELKLKTRKSASIKKWLLLACRLLAYTCIILAFAQPYFSKNSNTLKEKETVIYLDNSFSMQTKGERGKLFNVAVKDLIEYGNNDQLLTVFTNNKTYTNTRLKTIKNDLIATDYTANQLSYQAITLKAQQLFSKNNNTQKRLVIVSDFQNNHKLKQEYFDKNIETFLVKTTPVTRENISIDTAYLKTEPTKTTLITRIHRYNNETKQVPIALYNNDSLISKASTNFDKDAIDEVAFDIPSNKKLNLKIQINDAHYSKDNNLFITRNVAEKISVLAIGTKEKNTFLRKIFTDDEFAFTENTSNAINYSVFKDYQLIIWNEIENPSTALVQNTQQFANEGGTVLCIPTTNRTPDKYQELTGIFTNKTPFENETRITSINFSHPIYNGVFEKKVSNFQYPKVNTHYKVSNYDSEILGLENNNPLLVKKGNYYIFTAALNSENSNLLQSPIIVPTTYNIGKNSVKSSAEYYTIGKQNYIDIKTSLNKDEVVHLRQKEEKFIPLQQVKRDRVRIETQSKPNKEGFYRVENPSGKNITTLAYNYNRREGILDYHDVTQLNIEKNDSLKSQLQAINSLDKIPTIWKWFVIFAIVFLLIELLILKLFK